MNTRIIVKHRYDKIVLSLCVDKTVEEVENVSFAIAEWQDGTPICSFRKEEWGFVTDYDGQYLQHVLQALESLKEMFAEDYGVEWAEEPEFNNYNETEQ